MSATTGAKAKREISSVTGILKEILELIKKLEGGESTQGGGRRRRSTDSQGTSTETSILKTLDDVTNTVSVVLVALMIHYLSVSIGTKGVKIADVLFSGVKFVVEVVTEQLEMVKQKIAIAHGIRTLVTTTAYFLPLIDNRSEEEIKKTAEKVFARMVVRAIEDALKEVVKKGAETSQTAAENTIEGIEALITNAVPGEEFFETVKQVIAIMSAMSRARPLGGPNTNNVLLSLLEQTVGRLYRSAENIMVLTVIVFNSMDGKPGTRLYRHRHFHRHSHRHEHKETYPLSCKLPFIPRCLYKT